MAASTRPHKRPTPNKHVCFFSACLSPHNTLAISLSIQAGAYAALSNAAGITPVLAAAGHGQAACLQLLLRHVGAERFGELAGARDAHGRSALHFAAASGTNGLEASSCGAVGLMCVVTYVVSVRRGGNAM